MTKLPVASISIVALSLLACGFGPKFGATTPAGGGMVTATISAMKLNITVPETATLRSEAADLAVIELDPKTQQEIKLIKLAPNKGADSVEQFLKDAERETTAFSPSEVEKLPNGFDLSFTYWHSGYKSGNSYVKGRKQPGYVAQLTIDGARYECRTWSNSEGLREARKVCRTLVAAK